MTNQSSPTQPNPPSTGRGELWVIAQGIILIGIVIAPRSFDLGVIGALGLVISIIGLGIVAFASLNLGDNLTVFPKPKDSATLTDTGLYSIVRHPIYCGVILAGFGWALFRGSLIGLILSLALIVFFDQKAVREERWLTEKFPTYAAYKQRVKKLLPFVY